MVASGSTALRAIARVISSPRERSFAVCATQDDRIVKRTSQSCGLGVRSGPHFTRPEVWVELRLRALCELLPLPFIR
jgi:hypothetical protein